MAAPVAVCGLYCQPSPLPANHSRFYPAPVRTARLFYASPSFAAPQRDEADSLNPPTQAMSTLPIAASHRRPSAIPPCPTIHRAPPAQQSGPELSPSTGNVPSNHSGSALLPSCIQTGDSLIVPRAPSKVVFLRSQRLLGRHRFLRPVSPGHSRIASRPPSKAGQ